MLHVSIYGFKCERFQLRDFTCLGSTLLVYPALAPLLFFLRIKRSTLLRLQVLVRPEFRLSDVMRESLQGDPLRPVLTEPHLLALDRRLQKVLRVVQRCIRRRGEDEVITNDFVKSTAAPQTDTDTRKAR